MTSAAWTIFSPLLAQSSGELPQALAAPGLRAALLIAAALGLLLMLPTGALLARSVATILGALSRGMRPPVEQRVQRGFQAAGAALFLAALAFFVVGLPGIGTIGQEIVFWILAALTIIAAAATITMRSAVYAAIWFAVSLLGTAGLFIFQGAQFLGVATVVVYAGAIVVTFLFVVMLAQPGGHTTYDRISWGWMAEPMAVSAAAVLVGVLTLTFLGLDHAPQPLAAGQSANESPSAIVERNMQGLRNPVLAEAHMANLGRELFGRHLVAVEVAGTLLLAALVGAVAIIIAGKPRPENGVEHEGPQDSSPINHAGAAQR